MIGKKEEWPLKGSKNVKIAFRVHGIIHILQQELPLDFNVGMYCAVKKTGGEK